MIHILWRLSERRKNNGRAPLGAKGGYKPAFYYTLGLLIDFKKGLSIRNIILPVLKSIGKFTSRQVVQALDVRSCIY